MMIASQGTAKALKDFLKDLMPKQPEEGNDQEAFKKRFGGGF